MRIGLISDTHNDLAALRKAVNYLKQEQITTVLHAGDVTSSRMLRLLQGFDVWIARGNMDHDPTLTFVAHELFGSGRLKALHTLTLNGSTIALLHSPDGPEWHELVTSGDYDYVVHGHTHRARDEKMNSTRVINPGALGGARSQLSTFAILDLATGDLRIITF